MFRETNQACREIQSLVDVEAAKLVRMGVPKYRAIVIASQDVAKSMSVGELAPSSRTSRVFGGNVFLSGERQ